MTWRCEDCGSDEIVEEVRQNINTDEIVDSVDDSTTRSDRDWETKLSIF